MNESSLRASLCTTLHHTCCWEPSGLVHFFPHYKYKEVECFLLQPFFGSLDVLFKLLKTHTNRKENLYIPHSELATMAMPMTSPAVDLAFSTADRHLHTKIRFLTKQRPAFLSRVTPLPLPGNAFHLSLDVHFFL